MREGIHASRLTPHVIMTRFQKQLAHWYPVVFLLLFFTLALQTAVSKSLTMDEPVHIVRGAALWQTGDTRLQYEHTPLAHWAIGSLFPLAENLPQIDQLPDWKAVQHIPLTEQFLWQADPSPNLNLVVLLARLPVIFAGLFLGAVLVRWGKDSLSLVGQVVVMVFYAFSPNLLAHFSLATTDGMLTAVYLIAVFALWRFWQRPGWRRWLLASVLLGLALTTKLTALVLLPLGLALSYASYFQTPNLRATPSPEPVEGRGVRVARYGFDRLSLRLLEIKKWWQPGLLWLTMLPIAALVVWAVYGFELRPLPWLNVPLPAATYFNSLRDLLLHSGEGHISFLRGERSFYGWWNYFLVAFSVKTPAVVLALLGVMIVVPTAHKGWRKLVYWWLPPLILFVVASFGGLNIGYRHILPVLPFVWLLVGETAVFWWQKRWRQVALVGLLSWYVVAGLRQAPDFLAYFNEFVGGSSQGVYHLSDSNLDWGQDLPQLAAYLAANPEAQFSYFGPGDPVWAGIEQRPLTELATFAPANPAAGKYAISASHIQGIQLADWDLFDWFRRQEPSGNLGHSILLYDVAAQREGSWVAQCLDPGAILEETAVTEMLGITAYRAVFFDCNNSWVFPNTGAAGWYVLPQRQDWPLVGWLPDNLTLVYKHDASGELPSYAIYYWDGQTEPAQAILPENQQAILADGSPSPLPVLFGETVSLLGYRLDRFAWWTGWEVLGETAVPLTLAGHLYANEPTPLVADSLGFTSDQWQPGDIFFQRFAYKQAGNYLETGLYDYLSGERVPVEGQKGQFVQLHQ